MERSGKYRVVTRLERLNNRVVRAALRRGLAPRAFAQQRSPAVRSSGDP